MKQLTNDIEITEFLIQEIQNPSLFKTNPFHKYNGICPILSFIVFEGLITEHQEKYYINTYIKPKLSEKTIWLFPPFLIPPRVEFLQNLLKDLKKT